MKQFSLLSLLGVAILAGAVFSDDSSSCAGRCSSPYDKSNACQCNDNCASYSNCCSDFDDQCGGWTVVGDSDSSSSSSSSSSTSSSSSCLDRCGDTYNKADSCQCNDRCSDFNNCCDDYKDQCGPTVSTSEDCPTDLTAVSQDLWNQDTDRLSSSEIKVSGQGYAPYGNTKDAASSNFFSSVSSTKLQGDIYTTFIALLNNYEADPSDAESTSFSEADEQDAFLDAVLDTEVFKTLLNFLKCQGAVTSKSNLRTKLNKLWFELYKRSRHSTVKDSSGFEHVMVGEYKDSEEISGMHSWLSMYRQEKAGAFDYQGRKGDVTNQAAKVAFKWSGRDKWVTSFFLGVSPAYDMAIYTMCALLKPNENCDVKSGDGTAYTIKTYVSYGNIASTFLAL